MDKKVILLDTNIIYLLAGITSNDYNLKAIKKLCSENECLVDVYSIFEIYNNNNMKLDQVRQVMSTIKELNIKICSNDIMHSVFHDSLNMSKVTQLDRVYVKNKLSKGIIPVYSRLFSFLATVNFFIMFLFKKENDINYHKELGRFIGELLPIIENHTTKTIEKIFSRNTFNEKNLKNLYACLLSCFQTSILLAEEQYAKIDKELNNVTYYFNSLLQQFRKKDFMNCSMRFVMESSNQKDLYILPNMYRLVFKPRYPTKEDADCFFNDIVNWLYKSNENDIEREWIKYMIKNLLYDEANIKTNNFIDYLIIRDFTLFKDVSYLITCDGGMQKIMDTLSFNNKIKESLDIIDTLRLVKS